MRIFSKKSDTILLIMKIFMSIQKETCAFSVNFGNHIESIGKITF
mgnify:CR=1 FL=1